MKKLNRKGFTLIELLAVIVILAVVMGIAITSVLSSMNSARAGAVELLVKTLGLLVPVGFVPKENVLADILKVSAKAAHIGYVLVDVKSYPLNPLTSPNTALGAPLTSDSV